MQNEKSSFRLEQPHSTDSFFTMGPNINPFSSHTKISRISFIQRLGEKPFQKFLHICFDGRREYWGILGFSILLACFITSNPLASSRFPYHGQSFPLYTQFVGDRKGIKQLPSYQKLATKDFQSSPIVFHLFAILNFNNKKQVEKGRFFTQRDPVSLVLMRQRRKGREVTTQGRSSL